jgi:Pyruvate/2-oxoacid:ferredoxin oxidoreductase gamma subunit
VVVNTNDPSPFLDRLRAFRVAAVDGSRIAVDLGLGSRVSPVLNTTMLGAFSRATGLVRIDSVIQGIREAISQNTQANVEAAMRAFEELKVDQRCQ